MRFTAAACCCIHQVRQPGWCVRTCYCHANLLQGQLAEAVDAYERALAAAPNFEIVRNNLAIALTELGTRTKLDGEDHWLPNITTFPAEA
jgi:Tetratricopeptide repeat